MLRFPITDLLDEAKCYQYLLQVLHPDGLACPQRHPLPPNQAPHKHDSGAVVSYCCAQCHAIFNLFTGTLFSGTHYTGRILVLFLRGVHKAYLAQYVSMLEWAYNLDHVTSAFLRRLLRFTFTELPI